MGAVGQQSPKVITSSGFVYNWKHLNIRSPTEISIRFKIITTLSSRRDGISVALLIPLSPSQERLMTIIGDTSKARLLALAIDQVIAFALMLIAIAFVPESLPQVKAVFFVLVYLAYFVVLEALWSRTLGKFFQGLVVRKLDGNPCDWKAALIRGSLRIFEVNPLLLGGLPAGLVIIASERKQRIGDLLAGTVVVSNKLIWESSSLEPAAEQAI
jgi:uncharacterized RDD family membrane protein YckC